MVAVRAHVPDADAHLLGGQAQRLEHGGPPLGHPEDDGVRKVLGEELLGLDEALPLSLARFEQLPEPPDAPEQREFVNPPELDAPAFRVLADDKASDADRRAAAGELAAAPFYLVYLIDHVDVPMALGVKELKRGFASGRAIKYDKAGNAQCVRVFLWENDRKVSDQAIAKSDRARIDPAITMRST